MNKLALENWYKIAMPLFGESNAAPNKDMDNFMLIQVSIYSINSDVKSFSRPRVIFQYFHGIFNFQGLFKRDHYKYFQVCANPVEYKCSGPKVIKLFSCSTQLSMKF